MTVNEYTYWIDKIMGFQTVDAARTTSLPLCDEGPVLAAWEEALSRAPKRTNRRNITDAFDEAAAKDAEHGASVALAPQTRIRVFWTGLRKWYTATVTSSRQSQDENGAKYRITRVLYDAADGWSTKRELAYSHCLEDEDWALE